MPLNVSRNLGSAGSLMTAVLVVANNSAVGADGATPAGHGAGTADVLEGLQAANAAVAATIRISVTWG
jgi:hypothetical protein